MRAFIGAEIFLPGCRHIILISEALANWSEALIKSVPPKSKYCSKRFGVDST